MVRDTSTIRISNKIKQKLDEFKKTKSYNEILEELLNNISYVDDDYAVINREDIAYTLKYIKIVETGEAYTYETYNISYYELKHSNIGDNFSPGKSDLEFYIFETAKVIYKDEDFILLKVDEELRIPTEHNKTSRIIGVNLL